MLPPQASPHAAAVILGTYKTTHSYANQKRPPILASVCLLVIKGLLQQHNLAVKGEAYKQTLPGHLLDGCCYSTAYDMLRL